MAWFTLVVSIGWNKHKSGMEAVRGVLGKAVGSQTVSLQFACNGAVGGMGRRL